VNGILTITLGKRVDVQPEIKEIKVS